MSTLVYAQVGKLDRGQTYAPKISRRYAPGSHQKQGKRPKIFRRYAPEPCKSCKKAQNFPALRAGRPTTTFLHTYSTCVYSPVFQPGAQLDYAPLRNGRPLLPRLGRPASVSSSAREERARPKACRTARASFQPTLRPSPRLITRSCSSRLARSMVRESPQLEPWTYIGASH